MLKYPCISKFSKFTLLVKVFIITFCLFLIGQGFAQQIKPDDKINERSKTFIEVNSENEFCTSYLFRGLEVEDNFVYQPAVYFWYGKTGSVNKYGAGVWLNFRLNRKPATGIQNIDEPGFQDFPNSSTGFKLSETDLYLMHQAEFNAFSIKNTAAIYLFSGNDGFENSAEYILNASYSLNDLSLSGEFACDFAANPGAMIFTNSVSYEKEIYKNFSVFTSLNLIWASAKYNFVNSGIDKSAYNSAGIELALTYQPADVFYSKIRYQYNSYIDKNLRESLGFKSSFWGFTAGFNL